MTYEEKLDEIREILKGNLSETEEGFIIDEENMNTLLDILDEDEEDSFVNIADFRDTFFANLVYDGDGCSYDEIEEAFTQAVNDTSLSIAEIINGI